jgi:hypothetical protein
MNSLNNSINLSVNAGSIIQGNPSSIRVRHKNLILENCYNIGINIVGSGSGGLLGISAGYQSIKCEVKNCSNDLEIVGINCGGLCGFQYGHNSNNSSIINCYNTGSITGSSSGGLCGTIAGLGSNILINNCYNSGVINGDSCGGLCGKQSGQGTISFKMLDCYNTGNIEGNGSGGLTGLYSGYISQYCSINKCYNTGIINGENAGGLLGRYSGYKNNSNFLVEDCYNTGNIVGINGGGICGDAVGREGKIIISKCYNTGTISGEGSGGITGSNLGLNGYTTIIEDCINSGVIDGKSSGGIAGYGYGYDHYSSGITDIILRRCYNSGSINGEDSGGIAGEASFYGVYGGLVENCINNNILGTSTTGSGLLGKNAGFAIYTSLTIKECYTLGSKENNKGEIISYYEADTANKYLYTLAYGVNPYIANLTIKDCYITTELINTSYDSNNCSVIGNSNGLLNAIPKTIINIYGSDYNIGNITNNTIKSTNNIEELSGRQLGNLDKNYFVEDVYGFSGNKYPLLKVFRDNIVWRSDKYVSYDSIPELGVYVPYTDPLYREKVLKMSITDKRGLYMNNLLYRRVEYENLNKKVNITNDNSNEARLKRLKYVKVYNKLGK